MRMRGMISAFVFLLALSSAFFFVFSETAWSAEAPVLLAEINKLTGSDREQRLVAGAKKEGKVVYYGSGNVRDNQELVAEFKKRYPFLDVEYSGGSGTRVVERVNTEFLARHYVVDVVNANAFRIPKLLQAGVVGRYTPPVRRELDSALLDAQDRFLPLYTTAMVIGYNKARIAPSDVPKGYGDLIHPKWQGRQIALDLDAHSWFMGILGTMGEREGLEYCRKLAAQDLVRRSGHTLATQLLIAGEFNFQIEAFLHSLLDLKEKGAPIDYVAPNPLLLRPPSVVSITAHAPHPHAAALFVDFLLGSEGGQKIFAAQRRWPANVKTPTTFAVPGVKTWAPNLDQWIPKYGAVLKHFDEIFGGRKR